MSTINPLQNNYWQPESVVPESNNNQSLGQEDFFALLTTQLQYQDPSKPVDNAEMIAQMASFQTSEGIAELGTKFDTMNSIMNSSAALQASTLVGQKVLVPLDYGYNSGQGFDGVAVTNAAATNVKVTVENAAGETVKVIELGEGSGNMPFSWDGTDSNGEPLPEGTYNIKVNGVQGGKEISLPTATYANVGSVSLAGGTSGVVVNLEGLGGIAMSDVLEVSKA
ncbi:flagellar hook assembly protein FlgD [Agarivorans gilvus]|uniref:Basal-body rod modification protein FlgD n=1 Tax=Agarivorans gilvus TaxID=680279 RepID=A0ABQ1I3X9_9ALTE|nr:flagellar hook assembly protein FlgD [Agarivorans gilvus]GGB10659.1 basal-body rod modification protein FlgD [Agarivorans gilvus]